MALETATYITQLVATNPVHTDGLSQADSHMRLIKAVLLTTFPALNAAVTATPAELNAIHGITWPLGSAQLGTGSVGATQLAAGAVGTAAIAATNVTYAKIQNVAANSLLGNATGTPAAAAEITLGTGLSFSAGTLRITAGSVTYALIQNVAANSLLGNPTGAGASASEITLGTGLSFSAGTIRIPASGVTYALIQNVTNARLLGNNSGGAAAPQEISIGTGLAFSGTTLNATATSPVLVPAAFKNLSIKVTTNTAVAVAADYVCMTDGTGNFLTGALSTTVNLAVAGAAGDLDTGAIAAATWYAIWAIATPAGSISAIASTSFTAPSMPSGYTLKARIGAVRTAPSVAQLMGTWQFGRRAQYIVGLAQTTTAIQMVSGSAGSISTPTWVAVSVTNFIPSTASAIFGTTFGTAASVIVAPNTSYGSATSSTNPPPVNTNSTNTASDQFSMVLESANIYWASNAAATAVYASGWEDNI